MHIHHQNETRLRNAFFLIAGFMGVEIVGGLLANSLTLLADAGHMFLDATALGLAWYALRISRRSDDHQLSYGYHRFQVLVAFVNALTLFALVIWILVEAALRVAEPEGLLPIPTMLVAAAGFVVNLIAYRWLHTSAHNHAVESAALHVLGDLLGSAAAITAGAVVYLTGWTYADPLLALLIAVVLTRGAWRVFRQSAHILLEGVPTHLDLAEIRATLTRDVPGVIDVHHVHAWALTAEKPLLTLHATIEEKLDLERIMSELKDVLTTKFGIDHTTIQVEHGHCPDETPP